MFRRRNDERQQKTGAAFVLQQRQTKPYQYDEIFGSETTRDHRFQSLSATVSRRIAVKWWTVLWGATRED
jgi:hypothetical protein